MAYKYTKNFMLSLCSILLISCTKDSNSLSNFKVESLDPTPIASATGVTRPNNLIPKGKIQDSLNGITGKSEDQASPRFDYIPDENLPITPGRIVVIYKNSYKVRIDKLTNKLTDNSNVSNTITSILNKSNLKNMSDGGFFTDDAKLDKMQEVASKYHKTDIPHPKSIHYYTLSSDINTRTLCKKLRELPCVLTAYPALESSKPSASSTLINRTTPGVYGPKPSEPWFVPGNNVYNKNRYENTDWWWYNPERIFDGWQMYKQIFNIPQGSQIPSSVLPTIAIIDDGFDLSSSFNVDRPNYLSNGVSFLYNTTAPNDNSPRMVYDASANLSDPIGFDNTTARVKYSHGTACATIVAAPADGIGLAGIAPGAKIFPIKIQYDSLKDDTQLVAAAIRYTSTIPDIDAVSISREGPSGPINASPDVASAIATATGANKIVVIAAGNYYRSINRYTDSGEVVVGGTMWDNTTGRPVAWYEPSGNQGSNYGTSSSSTNLSPRNPVDISAGAMNISTMSSNTSSSSRSPQVCNISGTSFAVPQVAAVLGMMKRIAVYKNSGMASNPKGLRDILTFSSNYYRYLPGYVSGDATETKFLGADLQKPLLNYLGSEISVGGLNMVNAFAVVNNLGQYNALARVGNIDDEAWMSVNSNWGSRLNNSSDNYGKDAIWGINGLSYGDQINYATYNSAGGYAYGYGLFYGYTANNNYYWQYCNALAGVSGVVGADNNANPNPAGNSYYGYRSCPYH